MGEASRQLSSAPELAGGRLPHLSQESPDQLFMWKSSKTCLIALSLAWGGEEDVLPAVEALRGRLVSQGLLTALPQDSSRWNINL